MIRQWASQFRVQAEFHGHRAGSCFKEFRPSKGSLVSVNAKARGCLDSIEITAPRL